MFLQQYVSGAPGWRERKGGREGAGEEGEEGERRSRWRKQWVVAGPRRRPIRKAPPSSCHSAQGGLRCSALTLITPKLVCLHTQLLRMKGKNCSSPQSAEENKERNKSASRPQNHTLPFLMLFYSFEHLRLLISHSYILGDESNQNWFLGVMS